MKLFKTKYRIVNQYTDDVLSDIYVEYKSPLSFLWHKLKFNFCDASIIFGSGNLSFFNTYENQYLYDTPDWWTQERKEIERLLIKCYVNPHIPVVKKEVKEI